MIPHLTTRSTHAEIEAYVAAVEREIEQRRRLALYRKLAEQHPAEVEAARQAIEVWEEVEGMRGAYLRD